jgi:hypothetical protein
VLAWSIIQVNLLSEAGPVMSFTPGPAASPPAVHMRPYVIGILLLIAVLTGTHLYLLNEDVRKCRDLSASLNERVENLPADVDPELLIETNRQIRQLLDSDAVGCRNITTSFNAAVDKGMSILFSLITGASLAATTMRPPLP